MIYHTGASKTDNLSLPPFDDLPIFYRLLSYNLLNLWTIIVGLVQTYSVGLIQKRYLLFAILSCVTTVLIAVFALDSCVIVIAFDVAFALVALLRQILVYDVGCVGAY